jgi:hypothetical protein
MTIGLRQAVILLGLTLAIGANAQTSANSMAAQMLSPIKGDDFSRRRCGTTLILQPTKQNLNHYGQAARKTGFAVKTPSGRIVTAKATLREECIVERILRPTQQSFPVLAE